MYGEEQGIHIYKAVETSGEDGINNMQSEVEFTQDELINKLKYKYADISV